MLDSQVKINVYYSEYQAFDLCGGYVHTGLEAEGRQMQMETNKEKTKVQNGDQAIVWQYFDKCGGSSKSLPLKQFYN